MSGLFCKRQMSALQRRTMQQLGGLMGVTAALTLATTSANRSLSIVERTPVLGVLLSLVSLLPVLAGIRIVGRYLQAEPDEFVRALVTRALLWGFAVTMAGDAVIGALLAVFGGHLSLVLLNADLLFIGTGISFRLLQRSYR